MANFSLKSLTSFLSSFNRGRSTSVIGIDIGSSAIKVVQVRRQGGKAILETYGAIALGPYGDMEIGRAINLPSETIVQALSDVLREANITSRDAGVSIPYASSLVSVIKVPQVTDRQLSQMIPIEARKYIPVPIGEVMLDWFAIPEEQQTSADAKDAEKKQTSVLLVAIHNDTIAKYQSIVKGAAIDSKFFEIEVFSSVRASLDHGIAPVAVLDMGAATTKLYIVERGIVRESHIINRGSQDITLAIAQSLGKTVAQAEELKRMKGLSPDAEPQLKESIELTLQHLINEINRVVLSYEQHMGTSVAKMVATGGGATLKGLAAYFEGKVNAKIELADSFAKTEAPAFLTDVLKDAGPEFSVAVGLALRRLQEIA